MARRMLARNPDVVAVCHNDAIAGDVYVNHGIVLAAMQARGRPLLRMLRNPLHVFTWARDSARFTWGRTARWSTSPTPRTVLLRRTYHRLRRPTTVIGNGVDTGRLRPPTDAERDAARAAYGFGPDDARRDLRRPRVRPEGPARADRRLGGRTGADAPPRRRRDHRHGPRSTPSRRGGASRRSASTSRAVSPTRLRPSGRLTSSPCPARTSRSGWSCSRRLAYGLPVLATPVGVVPDVVQDGVNGYVVTGHGADPRRPQAVRRRARVTECPRPPGRRAEEHDWARVADRYVELLERLGARFGSSANRARTASVRVT